VRAASILVALAGLGACLFAPVAHFRGTLDESAMKVVFLSGSLAWFLAAGVWSALRR
jgi:hypothetical protein